MRRVLLVLLVRRVLLVPGELMDRYAMQLRNEQLLAEGKAAVTRANHLHLAHHLANDDFKVLVVNVLALRAHGRSNPLHRLRGSHGGRVGSELQL